MSPSPQPLDSGIEGQTVRKVAWRLIPFLMVCYLMAYIDRANVGMASLQMNQDLGLTPQIFAFASSLFFVAYFICEVPGNLALQRFGARRWLARIMITWGAVTIATAWVNSAETFYAARLLLGAAEAGFFPGVLLYFSYWLPSKYRARMVATFMMAMPIASVVGSPISAGLLHLDGMMGMRGWQWLFILEGIPTVLLGIACLKWLVDGPVHAKWLKPEERAWLVAELESEANAQKQVPTHSFWRTLTNKYVLCLALVNTGSASASITMAVWGPQILKSFDLSVTQTGFLASVPYVLASLVMVLWGRSSDRKAERHWHTLIPLVVVCVGCIGVALTSQLAVTVAALCVIACGMYCLTGPFWALAAQVLSVRSAAVGLATINAVSNVIGGGLMVNAFGFVKQTTGSFHLAILPLAGLTLVSLVALYFVTRCVNQPVAQSTTPHELKPHKA